MTKTLTTINLVLALGLAVVCMIQWRREKDYRDEIYKLDLVRQQKEIRIEELEKQVRGLQEDVAGFKERVTKMQAIIEDQESTISSNRIQITRVERENVQLTAAVDAWKKATAERDDTIKQQNDLIRKVAAERDDMVGKFNDLAKKHNEVVTKFNDLVKQVNAEREAQAAQQKALEEQQKKKKDGNP